MWSTIISHGFPQVAPDGKRLYVNSSKKGIALEALDLETGAVVRSYPGDNYSECALSPDGKFIAASLSNIVGKILIVDLASGKTERVLSGHTNWVAQISFVNGGKHLVSIAYDGSLKLWDLRTGACVFTALSDPSGAKWLAYTPDGYWDGSGNCGELVAMVRGMEGWAIDQFAVRNNRPDIIAARAGADPAVVAGFKSQYLRRLRKLGIVDAQGNPDESRLSGDLAIPEARILEVKTEGKRATIRLRLSDAKYPLDRYSVFVNDVPIFGSYGKKVPAGAERAVELTEGFELTKGDNKIEVSCWNSNQAESFRAVARAAYSGEEKKDLWFLGFGVAKYADPRFPELGYTVKDAQDLAAAFRKMQGAAYGTVHERLLLEKDVTAANIKASKDFLRDAKPDDTFVLFIAGHGMRDTDPESTYYYITQDADLGNLKGTAADFELIEDLLQGVAPRRKLFLMDTCASGEADSFGQVSAYSPIEALGMKARAVPAAARGLQVSAAPRAWLLDQDRYIFNDLVRRSGSIVFSSCKGGEYSYEGGAYSNGFFTAAILQALTTPAADENGNGSVSSEELRAYVKKAVSTMSMDPKEFPEGAQHPTIDRDNLSIKIDFPIVK